MFFTFLKEGLESRGWKALELEPCLFYKGNVMCLVDVNDCLLFGNTTKEIDKELEMLRKPKPISLTLEEEDDVAGFLRIFLEKQKDGAGIELKQNLQERHKQK